MFQPLNKGGYSQKSHSSTAKAQLIDTDKFFILRSVTISALVTHIITVLIAVIVLVLAIALDLLLGDPSPNNPEKTAFKLHPSVLMGRFTKMLEPHFKSPNPKTAKLKGAFLALIVILAFTVPVYFGLWAVYTYLSLFVYAFFAIILLKLTICKNLKPTGQKPQPKR